MNLRELDFYKSMDAVTASEAAEGWGAEYTEEEQLAAWQWLHDTGMAYQLQGFYGRGAQTLIQTGRIQA